MIDAILLSVALAATQAPEAKLGFKSDVRAVRAMHTVGKCIGQRHGETARQVINLDFRTEQYAGALRELARLGAICAEGGELDRISLRSGGLLFAGSIAEGLMARDGVTANLAARTAYRPELPSIEARNAGELMAFCAIRRSPGDVQRLLSTEPATVVEYDALRALGPTLSACVPANSKSEFTREALRALLALGTHRLATHNGLALATTKAGQ